MFLLPLPALKNKRALPAARRHCRRPQGFLEKDKPREGSSSKARMEPSLPASAGLVGARDEHPGFPGNRSQSGPEARRNSGGPDRPQPAARPALRPAARPGRMAQSAIQDLLKQAPHLRPDESPSIHPAGGGGGGGGRITVTLSGCQPADGRPVRGWIGAVVKPPYSFPLIALIMGDRWAHYRPRLESVFASLQTRGPARNRRLERALVGQWRGIYAKTGGSGSSSRELLINLSADMTFWSRYTSSLSAQAGSYASSSARNTTPGIGKCEADPSTWGSGAMNPPTTSRSSFRAVL